MKARMRTLEEEQRELREALAELLDDIERHAGQLPDDERLARHVSMVRKAMADWVKPHGTLVIIDKNKAKLGALAMPSWERWFDAQELTTMLSALGLATEAEYVAYDDRREPDGLFICWTARRPHRPGVASTPHDHAARAAF